MRWNKASYFEYDRNPIVTETTTWSGFSYEGKGVIELILASEAIN